MTTEPKSEAKLRRTTIDLLYADGSSQHITINGNFQFGRRLRRDYPELSGVLGWDSTRPQRAPDGTVAFEFGDIPEQAIEELLHFTDEQVKDLEDRGFVTKTTPPVEPARAITGELVEQVLGGLKVGQLVRIPYEYNPLGTPHKNLNHVWRVVQIESRGVNHYIYTLELREGRMTQQFAHGSQVYAECIKVDRWDFRRGDFVKVGKPLGASADTRVRKLLHPLSPEGETVGDRFVKVTNGQAAWVSELEDGSETWDYEYYLHPVEVEVKKSWKVKS